MNDMTNVHNVLSSADQDKQETLVCHGCIAYKEGKYEDAKEKFEEARKMGESSDILYNIGVSSYKMKKPSIAVEMFQEILKYVANNYPEVIVPTNIEGFRPTKISNSPLL